MRMQKQVAILGFGLEGRWLWSYLGRDKNLRISILDQKFDKNYLKNLKRFDLIYKSPGVPYELPQIQKVRNKVSSLTKLFFESASRRSKGTIIGVTGSAGKTTTATLLYKILKKARKKVFLAGNIGKNPLALLPKLSPQSITVMELSSFQLQDLNQSPQIAVILDIYEEHLDKHKSFKEYFQAKANIVRHQRKSDLVFYSAANRHAGRLARLSPGKKIPVLVEKAGWLGKLKLFGGHNYKNALAAALAAESLGVSRANIKKVIQNFSGLKHRLEYVGTIKGVKFYNDSKATNIGSAAAGMDAFPEKKVVLVGGYNKNLNFRRLAGRLKKPDISFIVIFGRAREEILAAVKKCGLKNFKAFPFLYPAVKFAKQKARPGEIVLLSPAAASFDEFKDYKERGEKFKKWVREK